MSDTRVSQSCDWKSCQEHLGGRQKGAKDLNIFSLARLGWEWNTSSPFPTSLNACGVSASRVDLRPLSNIDDGWWIDRRKEKWKGTKKNDLSPVRSFSHTQPTVGILADAQRNDCMGVCIIRGAEDQVESRFSAGRETERAVWGQLTAASIDPSVIKEAPAAGTPPMLLLLLLLLAWDAEVSLLVMSTTRLEPVGRAVDVD